MRNNMLAFYTQYELTILAVTVIMIMTGKAEIVYQKALQ